MKAPVLAFTNRAKRRREQPPVVRKVVLLAKVRPAAAACVERLIDDLLEDAK